MRKVKVEICFGTHCTMMGAMDIMESLNELKNELPADNQIEIDAVKCFDCRKQSNAPIVTVNGVKITTATAEEVLAKVMEAFKA